MEEPKIERTPDISWICQFLLAIYQEFCRRFTGLDTLNREKGMVMGRMARTGFLKHY